MEEKKEQLENTKIQEENDGKQETASPPTINPAVLEAFDGDLDDLMSWSSEVSRIEQLEKEASSEEEDDGIERRITADGREVEWFNIRAEQETHDDCAIVEEYNVSSDMDMQLNMGVLSDIGEQSNTGRQPNAGVQLNKEMQSDADVQMNKGMQSGASVQMNKGMQPSAGVQLNKEMQSDAGVQLNKEIMSDIKAQNEQKENVESLHRIDPNDPHYANYVPDMYYEYGVGPEPKMPTRQEMTGGTSGLAVASLCCGIASIVLFCCTYGFPQSIVGLVLGIITLSKKRPFDSSKIMALIGVILSGFTILVFFAFICLGIIQSII